MSTRASIIIKDATDTLYFYRHSDGYPECAGKDLADFVTGYADDGAMRPDVGQSAGWLIVRGHFEYKGAEVAPVSEDGKKLWEDKPDRTGPKANTSDRFDGWKVGAYEPTTQIHGDVEYIYIIDLEARTLTCRVPNKKFWDKPTLANTTLSKKFRPVPFDPVVERTEEDVVEAMATATRRLFETGGHNKTIFEIVALILKAADVGPERETRRAHDGVAAASFVAERMIGEMLTTGRVNV